MHKRFVLQRTEDESGVSGTGMVAEGTLFTNGKVVLAWVSDIKSVTVYENMEELDQIHGHGGKSHVVWIDAGAGSNEGS